MVYNSFVVPVRTPAYDKEGRLTRTWQDFLGGMARKAGRSALWRGVYDDTLEYAVCDVVARKDDGSLWIALQAQPVQDLGAIEPGTDDTVWEYMLTPLPAGGQQGQILAKASPRDYDAEWIKAPKGLPPGGTTGEVLTKLSAADGDADWGPAGAGSQTPWTGDEDASGFQLKNVSNIISDPAGSAPIVLSAEGGPQLVLETNGNVGFGAHPLVPIHYHVAPNENIGLRHDGFLGMPGFNSFNDAGTAGGPIGFSATQFQFAFGNLGIHMAPAYELDVNGAVRATNFIGITGVVGIVIDGGGSAPATGSKGFLQVPYNATITGWTMLADVSGSAQITVKKSTYAGFPTTASIVASAPPALSGAQKNTSTTLTGWTTAIAAGDVLEFNLDSVATIKRLILQIQVTRT